MKPSILTKVLNLAILLAFIVVMLGAYTRLTDAGLGCPDWPGCYGHMVLPNHGQALMSAQALYPDIPVESTKAWTEMIHRYMAGSLGLCIIGIAAWCIYRRYARLWAWGLLGLLFFQAALGMWTVTLKLLPIVVMGHLLGGITIFAILCMLRVVYFRHSEELATRNLPHTKYPKLLLWACGIGSLFIFLQIILGGVVSSYYAGVSCLGFPRCNGQWFPAWHFEGFYIWPHGPIVNYQGGILPAMTRISLQMLHRIGAVVVCLYVLMLSITLLRLTDQIPVRRMAYILSGLVVLQFVLGIVNVTHMLPLANAVLHNGVAALVFAASIITFQLCHRSTPLSPLGERVRVRGV